MDMLRSCYKTKMRFTPGGTPVDIKWFFCSLPATVYPGPSPFRSLHWEGDWHLAEDDGGLGEIPGEPRVYSRGTLPIGALTEVPLGTAEQFREGQSADATPLPVDFQGVPLACFLPVPPPPEEPVETLCCPDPIPRTLYFTFLLKFGLTTLDWPEVIQLDYDDDTGFWESGPLESIWPGSDDLELRFECHHFTGSDELRAYVYVDGALQDIGTHFSETCDPFVQGQFFDLSPPGDSGSLAGYIRPEPGLP